MPHLYIVSPGIDLLTEGFIHDQRDERLFRVNEADETLFIKYRALCGTVRLSLLTTNLDLILNRHKRSLIKFARRINADIIRSNLGSYLRDEKGLNCFWGERDLCRFDWEISMPKCLEIGSGNGGFLNRLAQENPDTFFLGTEINGFVLKKALRGADALSLKNIRYLKKNAEQLLYYLVPGSVLDAIYINFPDPWFKKRHQKRKLINQESVRTFAKVLKPGGNLFFTTDDSDYVLWCEEHFRQTPFFYMKSHDILNSPRFHTKYERKWLSEGKIVHALTFKRDETQDPNVPHEFLVESFSVPVPERVSSGTILKRGKFTVVFRDVYRGTSEDVIDTVISLGRFTWFVLFTWEAGWLHYSAELNRKFLVRQVKDYLARML